MGGLGQVWRIWNFMTQTQPDPLSKKKKKKNVTQPNQPNPKNQLNSTGWVRSSWFWRIGGLTAHL